MEIGDNEVMEASPEALADALVAEVARDDIDPGAVLDRLEASRRPYFTWALAWASWSGVLERRPDDETARRAVAALRSVEQEANRLDRRAANQN